MKVRFPKFDFSSFDPHWAPVGEFAQTFNAGSTVPAHIEPYLVKVMMRARDLIDPEDTKLRSDVDIFIKQEMQHCKNHVAFNKRMHESGYPGMVAREAAYVDDYDRFLKERSLRFNLAYCEGFEAMSSIAVTALFEHVDDYLESANPEVVDLWRWHLAEEYEHRTVAHDVYSALNGMNPVFAYFYRIFGFFYAVRHIGRFAADMADYLLSVDRKSMDEAQIRESKSREAALKKALGKSALQHILEIISPFYKPDRRSAPKGLDRYLEADARPLAA